MLTEVQEHRLEVIKKGLRNQLKAITIEKMVLAGKENEITSFHEKLEFQFNNYLDHIREYLEEKNEFKKQDVFRRLNDWTSTHSSLNNNLVSLKQKKAAEKGKEVWVTDPLGGKAQKIIVESDAQKEWQRQIEQVEFRVVDAKQQIQLYSKRKEEFERMENGFKARTRLFQDNCLSIINTTQQKFAKQGHGDWRDIFNYLISLVACLTSALQSCYMKTSSEKILDVVIDNIEVATKKAEIIDLAEAEYFGLIETPSFQPIP